MFQTTNQSSIYRWDFEYKNKKHQPAGLPHWWLKPYMFFSDRSVMLPAAIHGRLFVCRHRASVLKIAACSTLQSMIARKKQGLQQREWRGKESRILMCFCSPQIWTWKIWIANWTLLNSGMGQLPFQLVLQKAVANEWCIITQSFSKDKVWMKEWQKDGKVYNTKFMSSTLVISWLVSFTWLCTCAQPWYNWNHRIQKDIDTISGFCNQQYFVCLPQNGSTSHPIYRDLFLLFSWKRWRFMLGEYPIISNKAVQKAFCHPFIYCSTIMKNESSWWKR